MYIVETKNKSLEETAAIFDGDEAAVFVAARPDFPGLSEKEFEKDSEIHHLASIA